MALNAFSWISAIASKSMQHFLNWMKAKDHRKKPLKVVYYFFAVAFIATMCLVWLGLIPRDSDNALIFGYSPLRMLLLLILFLISVTCFVVAYQCYQRKSWQKCLLQKLDQNANIPLVGLISLSAFFGCTALILFLPLFRGGLYLSYYQRLLPVVVWGLAFSIITPIFLSPFFKKSQRAFQDKSIKIAPLIFLIILLLWAFIVLTKFGITRDPVYWDDNHPVPILEGQLWVFWWVSIAAVLLSTSIEKRKRIRKKEAKQYRGWTDIVFFVSIWFVAFMVWIQQPVPNCYFTPRIRPPNYEVYPYSDAGLYDMNSQSILLGEMSANQQIIKRPLFGLFLAGAHAIVGQEYIKVVFFQTLLLALIPAVLYLIGKEISSRWSGILLAGYVILAEWNTLKVASLTTTTNSKLLMTELPTTLLMACLVLILMIWTKKPDRKIQLPLVMGGLLGLNILLRSQTLILLPFIIAFIWVVLLKKWRVLLQATLLFVIGVGVVICPWLIRNWKITGKIVLEDPGYTQVVIQLYQSNQPQGTSSIIGNTEGEVSSDFFGAAIGFILQNPLQYAGFVLNNFLHNEILSIFILPVRAIQMQGLSQLVDPQDLFWINPENQMGIPQILLLACYLAFISMGIALSYSRFRLVGLAPLVLHLAYNLSSGLSRISGWRFLFPMQWVIFFYFAIGFIQLAIWFCKRFGFSTEKKYSSHLFIIHGDESKQGNEVSAYPKKLIVWFALFSLMGLAMVEIPKAIPQPYANQDKDQLVQEMLAMTAWREMPELKKEMEVLLQEDELVIEKGKAFYPRFYAPQDGEPSRNESVYKYRKYSRLIFGFIGKNRREIVLPMEKSPLYFPNASEVVIVGREKEDEFEVIMVSLNTGLPILYFGNLTMK